MSIAEVISSPEPDPVEAARRVYERVMASAGAHRAVMLQLRADELARHIRRVSARSADVGAPGQALDHWLKINLRQTDEKMTRAAIAALALGLERRTYDLPAPMRATYPAAHARLASALEQLRPYEADQASRDAAVVAGLSVPMGCLSVMVPDALDPSGVWTRRAATGFVRQALQFGPKEASVWLAAARTRPWAELHLDVRTLRNFNADGFNQVYRAAAELMRRRGDLAGLYGASWLYDPQVAAISPGLAFVRRTAEDGGARIVRLKVDPAQTAFAVTRSPTRRALVESGRYRPACYAMYWSAADLIAWADRAPASSGQTSGPALQVVRK
jgi:hypothetical protein